MPKLLLTLLQALIPGVGAFLSHLLLRARRLLSHVPPAVQRLLLSARQRAELLQIIEDLAGYANLTPADRRKLAVQFITKWLDREHIPLSESEVNLLIELLYAHLKRHHPERIAAPPVELGARGPARAAVPPPPKAGA
jgi:hypothetical protein